MEDASAVAGHDLAHLLLDAGPEELVQTRNAQQATFVSGLVVLDAVERLGIEPTACAGHSLGEYTALVAAGALGFEDAVRLVAERGEAMQETAEEAEGVMLAISGVDEERARIACRRADGDVWLANSNAPGECVIAGRPAEAERAAHLALELGATRVAPLAVQGAFHTPLMAPAQPRLRKALDDSTFYPLDMPVVANVDALAHQGAEEWPSLLSAQLRSPVRWRQSLIALSEILGAGAGGGDNLFYELGAGGYLAGTVRATVPGATVITLATPDDLDELVALLRGAPSAPPAQAQPCAPAHQGERLYLSERIVVSPCAGIFELPEGTAGPGAKAGEVLGGAPPAQGQPIEIGDLVGTVSGTEVRSAFAGELMGVLAHPGERVQPGQPIAWLRAR